MSSIEKDSISLSERLDSCSFIKVILMIFVIMGHSMDYWTGEWFTLNPKISSFLLHCIANWINSFHTYAFTTISGFIFAYKMSRGKYENLNSFLKNKIKRLIYPYIFTAVIWVIPISQYFFKWDYKTLIQKYILCENPSQLWFLWMLFLVFVFQYIIWRYLKRWNIVAFIIVMLFYLSGFIGNKFLPNIFCIWSACSYMPFFYVGTQMWIKLSSGKQLIIEKIPAVIWILADIMTCIIDYVFSEKSMILYIFTKLLYHIVGVAMIICVLQKVSHVINWKKNKLFVQLKRHSMPIYLFHQQIIYITITILDGKVSPFLNASINFIISMIGALSISWILMKFKVTRIFIGEK